MENKEQKIVELVKQIIALKKEQKATAAGYRDQLKELNAELEDLIDSASE